MLFPVMRIIFNGLIICMTEDYIKMVSRRRVLS